MGFKLGGVGVHPAIRLKIIVKRCHAIRNLAGGHPMTGLVAKKKRGGVKRLSMIESSKSICLKNASVLYDEKR